MAMHRCVRCGSTYEDNDVDILHGCRRCSGVFFLYVKGQSDDGVKQLDAVKRELQAKDTTIENELAKEIERKKAEGPGLGYEAAGPGGKTVEEAAAAGGHVEFETAGMTKPVAKAGKRAASKPAAISKPAKRTTVAIGGKKFALDDIFGIETVRMPNEGVYEINIDALMRKRPVIVLERGGIYVIHLPEVFRTESK